MIPTFSTNGEIQKHIEKSGREFWTIGTAVNGLPIFCAKLGGTKQPSILISAGSHASEVGGVVGALKLIGELQTDHTVYIVPNRDPMGLEGYHRYLQFALGEKVSFNTNSELREILKKRGRVVYEDQDLVLSMIGDFVFGAMDITPAQLGPSEVWLKVKALLAKTPKMRTEFALKRVVVPTNMPQSEGNGVFERAYTCYVTKDGQLKNLNRMFGTTSQPQEIAGLQALTDEVRPGMSLDLHEGFGDGFYTIVPPLEGSPAGQKIARQMVATAKQHGYSVWNLDALKSKFPDGGVNMRDFGEGILIEEVSKSDMQETMLAYPTAHYGPGFGVEAGRDSTLERRGMLHFWVAQSAVQTFESMKH